MNLQPSTSDPELHRDFNTIKILLNSQLKDILRNEHLPVSGVNAHEATGAVFFCYSVYDDIIKSFLLYNTIPGSLNSCDFRSSQLLFKDSPFYTVMEEVSPVTQCEVREANRDSVDVKVSLNETNAQLLATDPNIRAYLFCAMDNGLVQFTKHDVAFPTQVEVKVNMEELKTNFRGLKNRPGTVKPVDITHLLRHKAGYPNRVHFVYALTRKKFYVLVNLVRLSPVSQLIPDLRERSTLSVAQVVQEFKKKAQDTDIITTSIVLSLKCPLSTLRMSTPCRSSVCTHNQCFDASSYLELQQQATTWTCPVCNKVAPYESLQVDQYVDEILKNTPHDVDQVTIEPNGDWFVPGMNISKKHGQEIDQTTPTHQPTKDSQSPDGSDDFIEIPDSTPAKKPPVVKTEDGSSSDKSISHPGHSLISPKTTLKRPAADVIDLTLSDDEEPPAKRPHPQPSRPQSTLHTLSPSLPGRHSDSPASVAAPAPPVTATNASGSPLSQNVTNQPVPAASPHLPERHCVDPSMSSSAPSRTNTSTTKNMPSALQPTSTSTPSPGTGASTINRAAQNYHTAPGASPSTPQHAFSYRTPSSPQSMDTRGSDPVPYHSRRASVDGRQENPQNQEQSHAPSHAHAHAHAASTNPSSHDSSDSDAASKEHHVHSSDVSRSTSHGPPS